MAKGFGAIMAEVALARRAAKMEEAPACPLCGEPMNCDSGAGCFCYVNKNEHNRWLEDHAAAAYEYQEKGGVVFFGDLDLSPRTRAKHLTWEPEMQGVIIAVAIRGGRQIAVFHTIRGGGGSTNFKVCYEDEQGNILEPPSPPPQPHEWVWAEWAKPIGLRSPLTRGCRASEVRLVHQKAR